MLPYILLVVAMAWLLCYFKTLTNKKMRNRPARISGAQPTQKAYSKTNNSRFLENMIDDMAGRYASGIQSPEPEQTE